MRKILALAAVLAVAACAGGSYDRWDGEGLAPGQSTEQDVEKAMGKVAERRPGPNGSTVLWFPRLPYGRVSYAAIIGSDGKLISVEQRLTKENLQKLKPGASREADVRDLLGPPGQVDKYPRKSRTAWTYQAQGIVWQLIVTEFSEDGVLREAYMIDDPAARDLRM